MPMKLPYPKPLKAEESYRQSKSDAFIGRFFYLNDFLIFCISCTKYRGEPMERQRSLERKTLWSAMFLMGGYIASLLVEYATLTYIVTPEGNWRIEHAPDVSFPVALFASASLVLSIFPAFLFFVSIHHLRKGQWTSKRDKIHVRELLYYFALYQAGFGISSIVYFFLPYPLFQEGTAGSIIESSLPQLLMLGSALYLFKGRLRDIGFLKPQKWQWFLPVLSFFYFFNVFWLDELVTFPLAEWLHFEVESWREEKISEEMLKAKNIGLFTGLLNVAMVGFFVPIAEEMMFRGVMQTSLSQKYGNAAGIILTSFFFAFIHIDLVFFAPILVMGLMLGWLRYYFNSIWAPILFHCVNNTVSILVYYFQ